MAAKSRIKEVPTYIDIDEHLSLRQLSEGDAQDMFDTVRANSDYLGRWLSWAPATKTVEDSLDFILGSIETRAEDTDYQFGIFLDGEYIGNAGLHSVEGDKEPEIGYWVTQKMAGRGIATKATRALLGLAFATLDLPTVRIRADVNNPASNRVIEKCSFTFIKTAPHETEDRTLNIYRMNKEDWE